MSAFSILHRHLAEQGIDWFDPERGSLAIRSLPENEEAIRGIFGNKIRKGGDSDPYDWEIQCHVNAGWNPEKLKYGAYRGLVSQTVQRGDWIVLTPFDLIYSYAPEKFDADFCVGDPVSELRVAASIAVADLPPESEWGDLPPKSEWVSPRPG